MIKDPGKVHLIGVVRGKDIAKEKGSETDTHPVGATVAARTVGRNEIGRGAETQDQVIAGMPHVTEYTIHLNAVMVIDNSVICIHYVVELLQMDRVFGVEDLDIGRTDVTFSNRPLCPRTSIKTTTTTGSIIPINRPQCLKASTIICQTRWS